MSIESIQMIAAESPVEALLGRRAEEPGMRFTAWLEKELSLVNDQIRTSDMALRRLAAGETSNLHQVLIDIEKAKISFQLVLQVRNKLLEAYHDVMRMQV